MRSFLPLCSPINLRGALPPQTVERVIKGLIVIQAIAPISAVALSNYISRHIDDPRPTGQIELIRSDVGAGTATVLGPSDGKAELLIWIAFIGAGSAPRAVPGITRNRACLTGRALQHRCSERKSYHKQPLYFV